MVANNAASVDSRHMPVMSQGLRRLLALVFLLVALLVVNSTYLAAITLLEHFSGESHQGFFYLNMFLLHLALGLTLIVPFLVFGVLHLRRAMHRANRYAIRAGAALFVTGSLVLLSGVLLTRFGFFEVNEPGLLSLIHISEPTRL